MSAEEQAVDVPRVPDAALRPALEFAVGIAAAGQRLRPPLASPAGFKPHLKAQRLDRAALRAVRTALVGDDDFRRRIGEVATEDLVDPIGVTWLQRPEGWRERLVELVAAAKDAEASASAEAALRRAERRREAAEQAASRAHAELVGHQDALAREQLRRRRAETAAADATAEVASLRQDLAALRREVGDARRDVAAAEERTAAVRAELVEVRDQLAAAEATRDRLLTDRATAVGAAPPPVASDQPAPAPPASTAVEPSAAARAAARALVDAAGATRQLAGALAAAADALAADAATIATTPTASPAATVGAVDAGVNATPGLAGVRPLRPRAVARKPIAIPGGLYGDSLAAATHLLRTPRASVVVDGYNVAKLAWPSVQLSEQRARCIDLLEDVARRHGSAITVVFDGADVVGSSAPVRRLIRVQFSPPGVTADDVIRAEVQALPPETPVVVVTNDQAIVADVRAAGANVVASDMLLAVAGRSTSAR